MEPEYTELSIKSILWLHVKIPENYFKILEEGKNVGKFIFRRNVKIPENEPRKRKNPGKFFRKLCIVKMYSYLKKMIFW